MRHFGTVFLLASVALPAAAQPAAQSVAQPAARPATTGPADQAPADRLHQDVGQDIVVIAGFGSNRLAIPAAVAVLEGAELMRDLRPSLGEMLTSQPGVSSSFFGPAASRPILRGLDADRVRVLTDGIGSFDVSAISADHAVALNPLTADRVEVVRGPASLLYGSSAIGGVVNVTDHRIANQVPREWAHIDLTSALASNAGEKSAAALVDVPVGGSGLVAHLDGSWQDSDDYHAGGDAGRIDNSDGNSWQAAGGLSLIRDGGDLGFSVARLKNDYGIPNSLADAGAGSEEDVRIDMRQTRVDARAGVDLSGFLERLNFRAGWADYRHDEVEDSGEIGTSFFSRAFEGRMELVQRNADGWKGTSGLHYLERRVEVLGEEANMPLNHLQQFGLFAVESKDLGWLTLEAGGRLERSTVRAPGFERNFSTVSASLGLSKPLLEGVHLSANVAWSERPPSPEELLVDGPHAATRAYEIGNPMLDVERSLGAEAALRGSGDGWNLELSGFFNRFHDFVYLAATGEVEDGLPVFVQQQADTRHWGLEFQGKARVASVGATSIELNGLLDYVRADLLGGLGALPRIPPLRMVGGLDADGGAFGGRLEVEHTFGQQHVAANETTTPGWTMVNASLSWKPFGEARQTVLVAEVHNLFDVAALRHSSFLKTSAPLPGRDVRLSARFTF